MEHHIEHRRLGPHKSPDRLSSISTTQTLRPLGNGPTSHFWHMVIQLHILLCDLSAILDSLGTFLDTVALDFIYRSAHLHLREEG